MLALTRPLGITILVLKIVVKRLMHRRVQAFPQGHASITMVHRLADLNMMSMQAQLLCIQYIVNVDSSKLAIGKHPP